MIFSCVISPVCHLKYPYGCLSFHFFFLALFVFLFLLMLIMLFLYLCIYEIFKFESHWVPLSYGLVPHLSKKLSKFPSMKYSMQQCLIPFSFLNTLMPSVCCIVTTIMISITTVHIHMQKHRRKYIQADSVLFRYERFIINFWLRFFDQKRETIIKSLS